MIDFSPRWRKNANLGFWRGEGWKIKKSQIFSRFLKFLRIGKYNPPNFFSQETSPWDTPKVKRAKLWTLSVFQKWVVNIDPHFETPASVWGPKLNVFGEKFFFTYKSFKCNVPAFQNGIKLHGSSNGGRAVSFNVKKCIFLEIQTVNILNFKMKQNFEFFVRF